MRRFLLSLFLVMSIVGLSGCAGDIYMASPFLSDDKYQTTIKSRGFKCIDTDYKTINPYTFTPTGKKDAKSLYETMQEGSDEEAKKAARNDLLNAVLSVSDENVASHLASVTGTRVTVDMITGTAALGLAGVAAVSVADTAKYLAAGAAGATGLRSLFSEVVYRDALVQTLVGSIQTEREKYYETVVKPMLAQPVSAVGIGEIRRVAQEYHKRGHFYHGLTLIRQAAEAANQERTQIIEGARNAEARTRVLKAEADEAAARTEKLKNDAASADVLLSTRKKEKEAADLHAEAESKDAATDAAKKQKVKEAEAAQAAENEKLKQLNAEKTITPPPTAPPVTPDMPK